MNKKKYVIILGILLLLILIFFLFPYKYIVIASVNNGLDIQGFKLLSTEDVLKGNLNEDFLLEGGFGCKAYNNDKDNIRIEISGFPDVSSKYVVTGIITSNPKYSIFNIHVGDDLNKCTKVFKKKGFRLSYNINKTYTFQRSRVCIQLLLNDNDQIDKLKIYLISTNIGKVVF